MGVYQHAGWGELVDLDAVGLALAFEFGMESVRRSIRFGGADSFFRRRMSWREVHLARVRRPLFFREYFLFFVDKLEQIRERTYRLGCTQEQKPIRLECIMKNGHDLLLQFRVNIYQQIAATNQVHA